MSVRLPYNLITQRQKFNVNHHTEMNHLGKLLMLEPMKMASVMDQLFATQTMFNDNALSSSLFKYADELIVDKPEWTWEKRGQTGRPFVILEDLPANAGKGRKPFDLVLDEKTLIKGDTLSFGDVERRWQLRIVQDARRKGAGAIYKAILVTDNRNLAVPVKYTKKGTKVFKLFSTFSEGAELSGSMQHSEESFELRNRISRLRKFYQVTGDVVNEVLAIGIKYTDPNTQKQSTFNSWIRFKEALFFKQWADEKSNLYYASRANDTILDESTGRPVLQGAGLQEQMELSHRHYHSGLSIGLVKEFIGDIHFNRVRPGTRMNLQAYTGRDGLDNWSTLIQNGLLADNITQTIGGDAFNSVQKVQSQFHDNSYSVGHQFTTYRLNNGVDITVNYEPSYDDVNKNFEINQRTGHPKSSSRMTFLDFTGEEGMGSNIKSVRLKGGFGMTYVSGMVTPTGRRQGGEGAHPGDYYEMHCQDQVGCHIEDPTKCGELIEQ